MIKIESVDGICTITREGEKCMLFVGMVITPDEVQTIDAKGDIVYTIDESQVVVVPKGTKATISAAETPAVVEAPVEAPVETPSEAVPAAEVVPTPMETTSEDSAKK